MIEVTIENNKMAIRNRLVPKEFLCSPIKSLRLPKYKIQAIVTGSMIELKACETIIIKTGFAPKTGTTKPSNDIISTIIRYFGRVILRSDSL